MTQMPFYVSPEQLMKDRADFARKGIARGRSVVVLSYDGGIAFVAENPSRSLHKISEIYDRIGFAAVGKYNEFENLRVAGVRYADLRGYSYDRSDVSARGLANAYAQTLGSIFIQDEDQIFRLTYDGSVADEHGYVAMGGGGEVIEAALAEQWHTGLVLADALGLAVELLGRDPAGQGNDRDLPPEQLEVAVLDRQRTRRTFRRLAGPLLAALLNSEDPTQDVPAGDDPGPGRHDTLSEAPTSDEGDDT